MPNNKIRLSRQDKDTHYLLLLREVYGPPQVVKETQTSELWVWKFERIKHRKVNSMMSIFLRTFGDPK